MTETTNYHLKKPAGNDFVGPESFNENADLLDAALHGLEEGKLSRDPDTGKLPEGMLPPDPAGAKAAPADADWVALADSADGGKKKKLSWASVKTALGSVFAPKKHSHSAEEAGALPITGGTVNGSISIAHYKNLNFLNGGEGGVSVYEESQADDKPVLSFYGMLADESVTLRNLADPARPYDAASKRYVDLAVENAGRISTGFYIGTGITSKTIQVPFKPKAILIVPGVDNENASHPGIIVSVFQSQYAFFVGLNSGMTGDYYNADTSFTNMKFGASSISWDDNSVTLTTGADKGHGQDCGANLDSMKYHYTVFG